MSLKMSINISHNDLARYCKSKWLACLPSSNALSKKFVQSLNLNTRTNVPRLVKSSCESISRDAHVPIFSFHILNVLIQLSYCTGHNFQSVSQKSTIERLVIFVKFFFMRLELSEEQFCKIICQIHFMASNSFNRPLKMIKMNTNLTL